MAFPTVVMSSPSANFRSRSRSNSRPNLTITVPPLRMVPEEMTPEEDPVTLPPSNSLLVSRLTPDLLKDEVLVLLRSLIQPHAPIWSWNLDRRRSRIKISFYDIKSARFIKEALEKEPIMGCTPYITFAPAINTSPPPATYLEPPKSDKLFFISPPPSPPHGWEMRNEEPPNTDTHAHDLTAALERLGTKDEEEVQGGSKPNPIERKRSGTGRERSSSITVVYHPEHHGSNPALPAISVEDTEFDDGMEICESPVESVPVPKTVMPKTERPPMEDENRMLQ